MDASAKTVILYGGTGCHLCEQAKAVIEPLLEQLDWYCLEVDIRGDAALEALYGLRIPVLKMPSGEEKGWPFSAGQVRRLLLAAQP
ncbi:MAG: glutaredoxin family protein [Gammaproteobacteria bacterium]|nr:glutaredoxin family protein [Gammaproteobacteria bacterium]MBQ0840260.1 glutaredoxin family protein [Gammaproteobacteria bacterium]